MVEALVAKSLSADAGGASPGTAAMPTTRRLAIKADRMARKLTIEHALRQSERGSLPRRARTDRQTPLVMDRDHPRDRSTLTRLMISGIATNRWRWQAVRPVPRMRFVDHPTPAPPTE